MVYNDIVQQKTLGKTNLNSLWLSFVILIGGVGGAILLAILILPLFLFIGFFLKLMGL